MKQQAKPATPQELAYLTYWRQQGYVIGIDEPIPLNTVTPPGFATRWPILDAVLGGLVLLAGFGALVGAWMAAGAGVL